MKKKIFKVHRSILDRIKESPEERKERVRNSNLRTRVANTDKTIYDRNKIKDLTNKGGEI